MLQGMAMGAQANIVDSVHIFIAIAAHKGLAAYALGSSVVDSQVGPQSTPAISLQRTLQQQPHCLLHTVQQPRSRQRWDSACVWLQPRPYGTVVPDCTKWNQLQVLQQATLMQLPCSHWSLDQIMSMKCACLLRRQACRSSGR